LIPTVDGPSKRGSPRSSCHVQLYYVACPGGGARSSSWPDVPATQSLPSICSRVSTVTNRLMISALEMFAEIRLELGLDIDDENGCDRQKIPRKFKSPMIHNSTLSPFQALTTWPCFHQGSHQVIILSLRSTRRSVIASPCNYLVTGHTNDSLGPR
jgi:hypothetical protein